MNIYNSNCSEKYGPNSSNTRRLNKNCFDEKLNYKINASEINASTVKKILSSPCKSTYKTIYDDYSNECTEATSLSEIQGKFKYIQNIIHSNASCNIENIYEACCHNSSMCKNGVPSDCSASCSEMLQNASCNSYIRQIISHENKQTFDDLKGKCERNRLPLCTNEHNSNCIPLNCTSASNIPHEGCINLDCTDFNKPYEGCNNVSCTEVLYYGCKSEGINYSPIIDNSKDSTLYKASTFFNEACTAEKSAENAFNEYTTHGLSTHGVFDSAMSMLYNKDIPDYECDIRDLNFVNEVKTVYQKCSVPDTCSIPCAKNITKFYNQCKNNEIDEVDKIIHSFSNLSGIGNEKFKDITFQDYIETCYQDMCSLNDDLNKTVDLINNIHRDIVTDPEYTLEYTSLELETIKDRLEQYGDYIEGNKDNISPEVMANINQIKTCINMLEEGGGITESNIQKFIDKSCINFII